jgi:hypothetical protein
LNLPPAVLWINPGLISGLAILERRVFRADELPFQAACDRIAGLCAHWKTALAIGWEEYTMTRDTRKITRQARAMELIGVARYFATSCHCQVLPSAAPADRDVATPEMLKALGWWVPGKDDAQRAAQHLLAYLLRTGTLPDGEAAILASARPGTA